MSKNMTSFNVSIRGFDDLDVIAVDLPSFGLSDSVSQHECLQMSVVNNVTTSQQTWKWLDRLQKNLSDNKRDMIITMLSNYEAIEQWDIKGAYIAHVSFGRLNKRSDDRALITFDIDYDSAIPTQF